MKKTTMLLTGVLALILISCADISFDIEYTSQATIPSTGITIDTPFTIDTPPVETSSSSEYQANKQYIEQVQNVSPKQIVLTITAPDGETFSFLKSVAVYIDAEGLDQTLIAEKNEVADDVGGTLELSTSDANLAPFIKKDAFTISVTVTTDEVISQDIDVDVNTIMSVSASPF
jgi:hypothetical protein